MTWRRPNLLLLLVGLTLIHPSQENCNDYFDQKSWKNPPQRVALIRTNSSMDVMECSLERLYIQHNKLYPILRDCFERPDVTQISEKCEGEPYADVQFIHFMCWLAKAAAVEPTPDYCDDYESLCQIYSEIIFPPRRGRMAAMEISQGNLTLMIFLAFFVITTVVLLFVYLRMRRRMQLMMQQNVLNEVTFQAESQSIANMANTRGPEQAFLMQPPNNPQA